MNLKILLSTFVILINGIIIFLLNYLKEYYKSKNIEIDIYQPIIDIINKNNWNVELIFLEENFTGVYDVTENTINVTKSNTVHGLVEIAHEIGHFIDLKIKGRTSNYKLYLLYGISKYNSIGFWFILFFILRNNFYIPYWIYIVTILLAELSIIGRLFILYYETKACLYGLKFIKQYFYKFYNHDIKLCMFRALSTYIIITFMYTLLFIISYFLF